MDPIIKFPQYDPTAPASYTLSCVLNESDYQRVAHSAQHMGLTRAHFLRRALQALGEHMNEQNSIPNYYFAPVPAPQRKTFTARITEAEEAVVSLLSTYYNMPRSEIARRALFHFIDFRVRNHVRVDATPKRKPRAAQSRGPEKMTVSVRLTPAQTKFMRAYAKVYEMTQSDVVAHALDNLRMSEVAASTQTQDD